MKTLVPKLKPNRFTYDTFIVKVGYSLSQLLTNPYYVKGKTCALQPNVIPIGYCKSNLLEVKQKNDGYTLMVSINGDNVWFQCNDFETFEGLELEDYFNVSPKVAEEIDFISSVTRREGLADFLRVM